MTTTEEHPAPAEEQGTERERARISSGERIALFAGGFLVFVHLVVIVGFVVLSLGTDGSGREADSADVGSATPSEAESVFIASEFTFDPVAGTENTGNLTITLDNQGETFHNLLFDEVSGFVLEADSGVVSSADLQLEDGVYTLFCSVPGHRDLGMEATLTIESS